MEPRGGAPIPASRCPPRGSPAARTGARGGPVPPPRGARLGFPFPHCREGHRRIPFPIRRSGPRRGRCSLGPEPAAVLRRSRCGPRGPRRFFILVSLVFVTQLVGAVLFLLHWKQMQPELLLSELRRSYRGDEGAEVFSTAWNTLMVTFSCCGVLGPEDFGNGSSFQELHPGTPWPRVCCTRDGLLQAGELLSWEQCRDRSPGYIHEQGCFSAFGRTLQQFVSLPGICSLVVLGIEIFAMFFAFCLYYNFD